MKVLSFMVRVDPSESLSVHHISHHTLSPACPPRRPPKPPEGACPYMTVNLVPQISRED